jgi:hypothetical protein
VNNPEFAVMSEGCGGLIVSYNPPSLCFEIYRGDLSLNNHIEVLRKLEFSRKIPKIIIAKF